MPNERQILCTSLSCITDTQNNQDKKRKTAETEDRRECIRYGCIDTAEKQIEEKHKKPQFEQLSFL